MKRKNNKNKDENFEYEDQYTEDDTEYEYEDDEDEEYDDYEEEEEDEAPRPEKTLKVVFGIVIAAFVILGILVGVFFLVKNKSKDDETTTTSESSTEEINEVLNPEDKYPLGQYEVKIQANGTLNLREDHKKDSAVVTRVKNGTVLNITEVVIEENAKEHSTEYWGKTDYDENDSWVMMNFLVRYYGEDESAEDKETTEEKTTGENNTEEKTTEVKTTEEKTTEVTTTKKDTSSGDAPETGSYTVNADEFIRLRSSHRVDSDSLMNIPKGEKLTITEIYHNEDGDKYTSYWGKTTYGGKTGWVAMGYLG